MIAAGSRRALIMRTTARLDRRIDAAGAERRTLQAEAAQDRRALRPDTGTDKGLLGGCWGA